MGLFSFLQTTEDCCICIPLKIGVIILGVLYLMAGPVTVSRGTMESFKTDDCYLKHRDKFETIYLVFLPLIGIAQIFAGLLMIILVITKIPVLVDVVIILMIIAMVLSITFDIISIAITHVAGCSTEYFGFKNISGMIFIAIVYAVWIILHLLVTYYFIIVVRSYGEEINY